MNKKIKLLFLALVVCLCSPIAVSADDIFSECDSSHLRIFTPYHNLKSVFSEDGYYESKDSWLENQLTRDDYELIACVVHAESQGEPFDGKVGVASVILNRLYHPEFPKSVKDIIFQKNAFSCVVDGDIDAEPDTESYKAVDEALKGKDPTGNAVFFYNPETASSRWMKSISKDITVTIGRHVFFR